jgi:DivIVA domain-containing protein
MWWKKDKRDLEPHVEGRRLTPIDIQQAVFRRALFRGYREEEVDDFLDRVTEEIALLLEEQRRLRDQAPGVTAPPIAGKEASGPSELSPFLRMERSFLRDLAQIIQDHAEAVKEMAETTRREAATPAPPAPPVETPIDEQAEPTVVPEAEPEVEQEAEPTESGVFGGEQPSGDEAPVGQTGGRARSLKELFWGED